jgi:hypothetical protein
MKAVNFLVEKIRDSAVKKTVPSNIVKGEFLNLKKKTSSHFKEESYEMTKTLGGFGQIFFCHI